MASTSSFSFISKHYCDYIIDDRKIRKILLDLQLDDDLRSSDSKKSVNKNTSTLTVTVKTTEDFVYGAVNSISQAIK